MSQPNYMVDSAIYINWLRAGLDPRLQLMNAMQEGALYNCGVIRAEVLRGIKNDRIHRGMEEFFNIVPEVPTDAKLWRNVADLAWQLQREGKSPPLTDLIIALSAIRVGAIIVSPDAHFKDVPMLLVQTSWSGE